MVEERFGEKDYKLNIFKQLIISKPFCVLDSDGKVVRWGCSEIKAEDSWPCW